ncbi:glycoside hydrolase family 2 TIM barrel-domain containing protein [Anaerocolumna aminovalerica]|uniref:Beta-mannosidase B n=1 Tax=Anaerocolumna aminovalerica TaxID=1527 RepID=A0A1I5BSJ6_9FIRM|nr:glycoside hydrolase family 2 protein [Anaerocolumna aminovalerica]SFN77657.1 beta-mannosidase [Anaerocolumna aminovalerica]
MLHQNLNSNWKMRKAGELQWSPAIVPGSVYTDLLRNGSMDDPFWKDNENAALELMEYDYEYESRFDAGAAFFEMDKVFLCFEGIDTIADIYLNGKSIGNTYNMHRIWRFDVTGKLQDTGNILKVILHSPTQYIQEAFKKCRTLGSEDAMDGFVHIRKAHCMFGWDWGAHLPDAGIFREVSLLGIEKARIESVYIKQEHKRDTVILNFEPEIEYCKMYDKVHYEYKVEVENPLGVTAVYKGSPDKITITDPMLWWPNGYGKQYLYNIKFTLYADEKEISTWERTIGLRTMTMKIEKDQWGESFAHEVNGITIFAMGADYIPEDHLIGRTTKERTRRLLEDAKHANFNAVRVWGGGYYPEDWFFDLCDELGLIVWQDFMFACAVYELTKDFKANIRQEFIDNIKRIRHHASLGLWCGNNEMEQFVGENHHWVTKHSEVRDYLIMYEELIPDILSEHDPQTFYWPASPSSGGSFDKPNDPDRGDVHYWEVWHGNKPFSEYRQYFFRYASEFGFQSFPCKKTIETFTDDPADHNIFSYIMEKHQRNYGANGKIMNYLQQTYLYPTSFDIFLYASQLLQAEAIRYGVEHFRRNRGRCMGAIYWQLNDCWPVISWSSIDYTGRWKALHYYAKRFFAPLMLSCQEEGMMSQKADMNREHFEFEKSIWLSVANESRKDENLKVHFAVRNVDAEIIYEEISEVFVPALSSIWLDKKMLPDIDIFNEYVSYSLYSNENMVSDGTVIFSYPKYFKYKDPKLSYSVSGNEIIIKAQAYAKSVEVQNDAEDLVLSDNYFDMNAGEKRLTVLRGNVTDLRLRSVFDIK